MDLIYATPDRQDVGIIHDFKFDLAYGADENDFELEMSLVQHCCDDDYIIYMVDTSEGREAPTEYGGIVDDIEVDVKNTTVSYKGRTWHGILSEKVIEPEAGQDYLIVSGDAYSVLRGLIQTLDLSDFFEVPDKVSMVNISEYVFTRYVDAYRGISDMLADNGGKMKIMYSPTKKKAVITVEWLVDYSQDEEWDSTQVTFKVERATNVVNHLVCLGQGDLKDRYVIHLFTDENGGIQPYARTDTPIKDEDYILTREYQVLTGEHEIAEAYSDSSAAFTDNYVVLQDQPYDWNTNYSQYYEKSGSSGSFSELKSTTVETYTVLNSQPSDWASRYGSYYTSSRKAVTGVSTERYTPVTSKPADWSKNWGDYYVHFWDGTQYSWNKVGSVTKYTYKKQTKKPSDWATNYNSYYQYGNITKTTGGKKKVTGKGYTTVSGVKNNNQTVAPAWKKNRYYTRYSSQKAPTFSSGLTKYRLVKDTVAPTWASGTYYSKSTVVTAPPWKSGVYYQKFVDHYAELVRNGVKKINEAVQKADSIDIALDLIGEYDIGDIVGATEQTTGISVWQAITKKIVSINRSDRQISYKIG